MRLSTSVTIPNGSFGDRSYEAHWQANAYTITLDANGGLVDGTTIAVVYNQSFTLPGAERKGYIFLGWTYDGQKTPEIGVTIKVGTAGNKRFTAKWKANDYTVTFDANGGTVIAASAFKDNQDSRSGYGNEHRNRSIQGMRGDRRRYVAVCGRKCECGLFSRRVRIHFRMVDLFGYDCLCKSKLVCFRMDF